MERPKVFFGLGGLPEDKPVVSIELYVPTAEELAPIRERLASQMDLDKFRADGTVAFHSALALFEATTAVRSLMLSHVSADDQVHMEMVIQPHQIEKLDDMIMRMLNVRVLAKHAMDENWGNGLSS